MENNQLPRNVIENAEKVIAAFNEIDDLKELDINIDEFGLLFSNFKSLVEKAEQLKEERKNTVKIRNKTGRELHDFIKKIRYAAAYKFGDDHPISVKLGRLPRR